MNSRRQRTERYRREADRVRAVAETIRDPHAREQLLGIAQQYETSPSALSGC
jgi:hypothetical protein